MSEQVETKPLEDCAHCCGELVADNRFHCMHCDRTLTLCDGTAEVAN